MVLSREFECSQAAIYKDYERMSKWVKLFLHDNHLTFILRERLEILFREAIKIVLNESINNDYVKIAAINTALKITKEQIKLGFALGLIKRKAPEINQNPPLRMPFEFNPVIMQALAESVKQQRAEKKAKTK